MAVEETTRIFTTCRVETCMKTDSTVEKGDVEGLLTEVAEKHGVISIAALEEEGVSKNLLYRHFSGVEEAQQAVIGDVETTCSECGEEFETRQALIGHRNAVSHERQERLRQAREMLGEPQGQYAVYTARIEREADGEEFVYVGMSSSPVGRLAKHLKDSHNESQNISLPAAEGERLSKRPYQFVELIGVEWCETIGQAREVERVTMLEHCLERGDTKVVGGK